MRGAGGKSWRWDEHDKPKDTMERKEQIAAIQETADEVCGTVRENYSGRGMFGKTCYGIVCPSASECVEAAVSRGIRGAVSDSMGKNFIVYWPKITGS
jgi:hypothetical protein